ncbi:hypothetical protein HPB51_009077 [Rhipicephalus microplus]|uniref:Uncharacterized protein n=1 Tax=Rhipicephalus microplus TaxID=6941 RepID=A0A9J6F020_RHIMP|nr:hypothetical protein HPB51_009077 [Rhipicephalus microplus]
MNKRRRDCFETERKGGASLSILCKPCVPYFVRERVLLRERGKKRGCERRVYRTPPVASGWASGFGSRCLDSAPVQIPLPSGVGRHILTLRVVCYIRERGQNCVCAYLRKELSTTPFGVFARNRLDHAESAPAKERTDKPLYRVTRCLCHERSPRTGHHLRELLSVTEDAVGLIQSARAALSSEITRAQPVGTESSERVLDSVRVGTPAAPAIIRPSERDASTH